MSLDDHSEPERKSIKSVNCPTCKTQVIWDSRSLYRPFCSKRCQLIDLGAWSEEEYRIPENQPTESWSDSSSSEQFENGNRHQDH